MALHRSTANAASTLVRLKSKKAQLELKANQLSARKADVEARADQLGKSLKRTIDTREKILLGALMKMTGMDRFTFDCRLDNLTTTIDARYGAVMTKYDIDLVVGALLTLSEQLNGHDTAMMDRLRIRGREFRSLKKSERSEALMPHPDDSQ